MKLRRGKWERKLVQPGAVCKDGSCHPPAPPFLQVPAAPRPQGQSGSLPAACPDLPTSLAKSSQGVTGSVPVCREAAPTLTPWKSAATSGVRLPTGGHVGRKPKQPCGWEVPGHLGSARLSEEPLQPGPSPRASLLAGRLSSSETEARTAQRSQERVRPRRLAHPRTPAATLPSACTALSSPSPPGCDPPTPVQLLTSLLHPGTCLFWTPPLTQPHSVWGA